MNWESGSEKKMGDKKWMSEREREMCKDVQCVQCAAKQMATRAIWAVISFFWDGTWKSAGSGGRGENDEAQEHQFLLLSFGAAVLFPGHFVHSPGERRKYQFTSLVSKFGLVLATDRPADLLTSLLVSSSSFFFFLFWAVALTFKWNTSGQNSFSFLLLNDARPRGNGQKREKKEEKKAAPHQIVLSFVFFFARAEMSYQKCSCLLRFKIKSSEKNRKK